MRIGETRLRLFAVRNVALRLTGSATHCPTVLGSVLEFTTERFFKRRNAVPRCLQVCKCRKVLYSFSVRVYLFA